MTGLDVSTWAPVPGRPRFRPYRWEKDYILRVTPDRFEIVWNKRWYLLGTPISFLAYVAGAWLLVWIVSVLPGATPGVVCLFVVWLCVTSVLVAVVQGALVLTLARTSPLIVVERPRQQIVACRIPTLIGRRFDRLIYRHGRARSPEWKRPRAGDAIAQIAVLTFGDAGVECTTLATVLTRRKGWNIRKAIDEAISTGTLSAEIVSGTPGLPKLPSIT